MDAVQRAFESQIRREEYKRVQLQNAVSLEEERLLREREKEERERIRQHMTAAQHLQRLQMEEYDRLERARKAALTTQNREAIDAEYDRRLHEKQYAKEDKLKYLEYARDSAEEMAQQKVLQKDMYRESVRQSGQSNMAAKKGSALTSQSAWNWSCMNTEYLRQQALQLNKERMEDKEVKRSMTYHRAREEEQARIEYHQRKIEETEEKARYMEAAKLESFERQREALQMRSADIHRKVKHREQEDMAWRAAQAEKYQSKRERADWVEMQKKRLIKEMMHRRQTLSHDQEMLTNALSEMRATQSMDDGTWRKILQMRGGDPAAPRLASPRQPSPRAAAPSARSGPEPADYGLRPRS
eukprot:CAMPEP_0118926326 /NCGR_PEP_ID=MMETSP1169-20130426/4043_1 /TAXON_ID=36882 /ORGANISM="Pyramimonas obovata, Strain CCMP722" /LENGTH=355 /DNA_ID=CAMNT_0006867857 /DNA_START=104 /DNA_END=1168 /DNA_ORIENTATION=-